MRLRLWLGVLALLHVLLHGGTQAHNNINNTPLQVQKSAAAINIPSPELVDTEDVNTKNTKEIETTDVNIPEIPLNTKNNVNTNMKIETTDVNIPEVPLNTKNNVNSKKIETLVDVNKKIETPVDVNKKIETPVDVNTKIETPVDVNKKIETPVDVNTKIETPVDVNSKKIETSFSVISKGVVRHRPPPPALRVTSTAPPVYHRLSVGDLGTVRGVVLKSLFGRDFYGFLSLPYAKPPVNDLRFKYPVAWEGTLPQETTEGDYDGTWLRARCPQNSLIITGIVAGREDCLHLSVYTPTQVATRLDTSAEGLPVMLFIHGGAYMTGDANLYVPTKLMDRNIIVVTIQYRLSLLGFLAGDITEAPGNMGLMDQVTALRWVQKHISYFGGNPDLVTVFGQSAGGASTSWMHLTPLTQASNNGGRQLLHRVIPQSGSALEVWTLDDTPLQSFQNTAQVLECWNPNATTSTTTTTTTTQDIVACMRDKSFQEVVNASNIIYTTDRMAGGLGFRGLCPVVQTSLVGSGLEMVIPKPPQEIIAAGEFLHVPVMSGSVRDEGSLVLGLSWKDYMLPNNISIEDQHFTKFEMIPMFLNAFGLKEENGVVANSMRLSYLPNAEMGNWYSMIGGMVDMGGVMFLKSGLWELATTAQQAVNNLTVFFYSFEFESADDSLFEWIFISHPDIPVEGGVCHADELLYLFHLPLDADSREATMVRRLTLLWSNFAKYGNPTPANHTEEESWEGEVEEWLPFTADVPNFMLIEDHFTLQVDYPTRWNYHLNNTKESLTKPPSPSPTTITTTTTEAGKHEYNNTVSRDEYEAVVGRMGDFKIASGVLGGLCGMLLILFVVVLVIKGRRTGEGVV